MQLTKQQIDDFKKHGAVVIRNAFPGWIESLKAGIEKNLAIPGPFVRDYNDNNAGRFFGDYCNWDRIEEYRNFLFHSPAASIAGQLMESQSVRLFHEHVLVKETATAIATPWHHDQPYYCVDGTQNCSLWLALDPVDRNTTLEFVSGSHRLGKWFSPQRFDKTPLYDNDGFEPLPDIDENRDQYDVLGWAVEPGDAVAFHFLTLHGSPGNESTHIRRRAFSSRWVGDDARFAIRQGKTSPPFPDCLLKHGDKLDSPEFPQVIG